MAERRKRQSDEPMEEDRRKRRTVNIPRSRCIEEYSGGSNRFLIRPIYLSRELSEEMMLDHMPHDANGRAVYSRALFSSWWNLYHKKNPVADEKIMRVFGETFPVNYNFVRSLRYLSNQLDDTVDVTPAMIESLCDEKEYFRNENRRHQVTDLGELLENIQL